VLQGENGGTSWVRVPDSTPARAPRGARIIVCVQIAFEDYIGPTVGANNTSIAPRFPAEAIAAGQVDLIGRSWQDYGVNAGLPRLLRVLAEEGISATVPASGMLAGRCPDLLKRIVDEGHEVCGHSWAQDVRLFELSAAEEYANLARCAEGIEKVCGVRPLGWVSPAGQLSATSLRALAHNGYLYSLDFKDDDVPYLVRGSDWDLVGIPNPYDINDVQQYSVSGNPPSSYVEIFKHTFDMLYEEGMQQPKIVNAIMHPPLFGRPFGALALREVIRYAKSHDDVWFARRDEVARWVLDAASAGLKG
jgi:peptidoglycan/xylan/chitin deacetylase (PgdA/CDA1 family)